VETKPTSRKLEHMRTTKLGIGCFLLTGLLAAQSTPAGRKAQGLIQAAQTKEAIQGDLKGAIELYRRAAREAGSDHATATRALLALAACYEKQGAADARKVYEEILAKYPGQGEAVAIARRKLGRSGEGATNGATVRLLWSGIDKGNTGEPSPDGRYVTYTRWLDQDLMVFDTATGEHRVLYKKGSWENHPSLGFNSHISPDGKQVAFLLDRGRESTVLVVDIQGGMPRKIRDWKDPEWGAVYDWMPDGRSLFYVVNSKDGHCHFGTVSVADGQTTELFRVPQDLFLRFQHNVRVSPDGHFAAFVRLKAPGARERDIYVKSLASAEASWPLVADSSDDYLMDWTPDGNHIAFGSDRATEGGAFLLAVKEGRAQGSPVLLKQNLNDRYPMGFDRQGRYYFNVNTGNEHTLHVAGFDAATGKIRGESSLAPAARGVAQGNWVVWSADGRSLAYLYNHRQGAERGAVYVEVNLEEGKETRRVRFDRDFPRGILHGPEGRVVIALPIHYPPPMVPELLDTATGSLAPVTLAPREERPSSCASPTAWVQVTAAGVEVSDAVSMGKHLLLKRDGLPRAVGALAVSPDCRSLAWRDNNNSMRFLDLGSRTERELVPAQNGVRPGPIAFTPDGRRVLFGKVKSPKGAVELWSVPSAGGPAEWSGLAIHELSNVVVSPDGQRLLYCGGQGSFDAYVVENLLPAGLRRVK
jgi:Tol biopolymer transport system component